MNPYVGIKRRSLDLKNGDWPYQKNMGIRGLLGFLKDHDCMSPLEGPLWPPNSVIAVDVPIFAHKFAYSERTIPGIFRRMLAFGHELRGLQAEPIFVFDGAKLALKDSERRARAAARDRGLERLRTKQSQDMEALLQGIEGPEGIVIKAPCVAPSSEDDPHVFQGLLFPTAKDYRALESVLQEAAFKTARAKYEAEALCAHLTREGQAYAVLTEDSDVLAFGATRAIFKYTTEPAVYELSRVLERLGFTMDQFVDLCCLFGCDFCTNIYMFGPQSAYRSLQKHGSWPAIWASIQEVPLTVFSHANMMRSLQESEAFNALYPEVRQCFLSAAHERDP